jgi:hypothetical protein
VTGPNAITFTCGTGSGATTQTINISSGNQMTYTKGTTGYTVVTKAGGQGDKTYTYTSSTGQITSS